MIKVSAVKDFFTNLLPLRKWTKGQEEVIDENTCALCGEKPIVIPYCDKEGNCQHKFCYYCIQQKVVENSYVVCPIDRVKIVNTSRTN